MYIWHPQMSIKTLSRSSSARICRKICKRSEQIRSKCSFHGRGFLSSKRKNRFRWREVRCSVFLRQQILYIVNLDKSITCVSHRVQSDMFQILMGILLHILPSAARDVGRGGGAEGSTTTPPFVIQFSRCDAKEKVKTTWKWRGYLHRWTFKPFFPRHWHRCCSGLMSEQFCCKLSTGWVQDASWLFTSSFNM